MDHVIAEGQASRRFNAALISAFAGAAVLLALLGICSVIAFPPRCAPRRWPFPWHLIRSGPDWCYFPAESDQGFVR
jgi:hypothetical protein